MMTHTGKIKAFFWTIFSIGVGVSLVFFITSANYQKIKTGEPAPVTVTPVPQEPEFFYFLKDGSAKPKVAAEAYIVGDLDTGEIILKKNEKEVMPLASVSKLMTALVSTELPREHDTAIVSPRALATYGENGGFRKGEKIQTGDLLYPLLLESSNDAAEILAEHFGRENFIAKMNQESERLALSASFADPSGLSAGNQGSALDLFRLAGFISTKKPELFSISSKRTYKTDRHIWSSNNQFLREEGYQGGKSGYTDPARQTVLSVFILPLSETGNRTVAIALLRSPDRYADVMSLVKYLKKNVYYGGEADADTAWVKEKEGVPEIKDPDFLTLVFGGDIMLDRGVKNSVMKNFGGDYTALFENLGILQKADIAFANLEGPASDQGADKRNLYSFRMDPTVPPALKGAGFSVLSLANNHVGDWGRNAFTDTLARLKENEILTAGGGMNYEEAKKPAIIEKYGIKIGYIAFSDVGPDWMKATETEAGLLLASDPNFDEIIKNAAAEVDHLVVSFHFGDEYQTKHNERQETLAHRAVDAGAKLVIGAHPHVVQDTEIYKNGYIAYSLGNFIFDQYFSVNTMRGALLEIKIKKDGSMTAAMHTVPLSRAFQPEKVIKGKEEKVKFEEVKTE